MNSKVSVLLLHIVYETQQNLQYSTLKRRLEKFGEQDNTLLIRFKDKQCKSGFQLHETA